jgi:hypothetical protein
MKTNEEVLIEMTEKLLGGAANDYLSEFDVAIPLFEVEGSRQLVCFGVRPEIEISECELTEKERVIKSEAYTLKITFQNKSKNLIYYYAYAIQRAIDDDVSFGGIVDRVTLVHKKYQQKNNGCEIIITLRATLESLYDTWE